MGLILVDADACGGNTEEAVVMGDAGDLAGATACAEIGSDSYALRGYLPPRTWYGLWPATDESYRLEAPLGGTENRAARPCHAVMVHGCYVKCITGW
jgi:hypothetical protein